MKGPLDLTTPARSIVKQRPYSNTSGSLRSILLVRLCFKFISFVSVSLTHHRETVRPLSSRSSLLFNSTSRWYNIRIFLIAFRVTSKRSTLLPALWSIHQNASWTKFPDVPRISSFRERLRNSSGATAKFPRGIVTTNIAYAKGDSANRFIQHSEKQPQ